MKIKFFCAAATVTTLALLLSAPLEAQWLNFKTPGIPRTADGKPDVSAPAPRAAVRRRTSARPERRSPTARGQLVIAFMHHRPTGA